MWSNHFKFPTVPIFKNVISEIVNSEQDLKTKIIIDMNTISLEDKLEAKNKLKKLKIEFIDAPVSGTGAQAKSKRPRSYVKWPEERSWWVWRYF